MKTCRFLVSVPFVLAALVVSLALGADTASAAEPRIVGEWRFSGTGDERLKATVGRDLVKYTRTGAQSLDLAGGDGIRPGDGYLRAGQNSGLKCFHGLPKDSSYTVVMDVRVPTEASGKYFALFQPDPDNDSDCRYYLMPGWSAARLCFWVASVTYTDDVAKRDEWIRVAFTYEHDEYKTLYVNGEKVNARSDSSMKVTGDVFYFLVDNNGEDDTTDISYVAIYDGVLTDDEIAVRHSRCTAHDADGVPIGEVPKNPRLPPSMELTPDKAVARSVFDTFAFTIAGASTGGEPVYYRVDYGDGTAETTSSWETMGERRFSHVYDNVGTYTVKAEVFTYSGAVAERTTTVTATAAMKRLDEVVRIEPWQQNVYTNRFTIMFEAISEQPGIELQYGTGFSCRVPMTGFKDNGGYWLYKAAATVDGQAGEEIPYRLGFAGQGLADDPQGLSSGVVRLWSDDAADFSCAVWGDNQQGSNAGDWDSDKYAYVSAIFRHMIARNVDFGISTGDMSTSAAYSSQIFPLVLERTNRILGRYKPYYVAFGNHDTTFAEDRPYFETPAANDPDYAALYAEKSRGNYYLYRGNVLFVFVDYALQGDADTKTWLQKVLATNRARQAKFRVVLHHFPFYVECWGNLSDRLVDICKNGNVDLVLSGHMHGYERIERNGIRQVTNGGAAYLDHDQSIANYYGTDTKVGGHRNIPYLWARQKSISEPGVLGGAEPVRMGCLQSYGELSVKGGVLTYTAHGFDANGGYIGVFDTLSITSRTMTVAAPSSPRADAYCANHAAFAEFTARPVTNAKWAEYKTAVGETFEYPEGAGSRPVVNVSRTAIERFLVWLNGETGDYRLPTVGELAVAFGDDLRREVSEWTSSVDPDTGWCRILGAPAKALDGTWTRPDDRPSVSTPDCHADYLGFRLATGPVPVEPVSALAAPLAALAEIASPARAYKWENGRLVDISDVFYALSGAQSYDVPVILTGSGAISRANPDALAFNAGFSAPKSTSFLTAGALTVKGDVKAGVVSDQWQWRMGSADGTLTVDNVTYRGVGVTLSAGDRTVRVKGDCDFSGAMLAFDQSAGHPTNIVTAVDGEAATIRFAAVRNFGTDPFRVGENVTMKLAGDYRVLDSTEFRVDGVVDAEAFNIQGNKHPRICGAGSLRIGSYGSCQNSMPSFGVSNIVVTTRRFWRNNSALYATYNAILIDGDEVHFSSTCDWEVPPKDHAGLSTYFISQNRGRRAKVVFDGDHDVRFAPSYTVGALALSGYDQPWVLGKAGTGTLTLGTSFDGPVDARSGTVRLDDGVTLVSETNRLAAGATLQLAAESGRIRLTSEGGSLALAPGVTRATLARGSLFSGPVARSAGAGKLALGYTFSPYNPEGVYEVFKDSGLSADQIDFALMPPRKYYATAIFSPDGDVTIVVLSDGKTFEDVGLEVDANLPINYYGVYTPSEKNERFNFVLQNGSTLDLTGCAGIYDCTSSATGKTLGFASDSTIVVKLGNQKKGKIVAWTTRPDASVTFVSADGRALVAGEEGLYAQRGSILFVY